MQGRLLSRNFLSHATAAEMRAVIRRLNLTRTGSRRSVELSINRRLCCGATYHSSFQLVITSVPSIALDGIDHHQAIRIDPARRGCRLGPCAPVELKMP